MSYIPSLDTMRWDLINKLLSKSDGPDTNYLEIGIDYRNNLDRIVAGTKDTVDPFREAKYKMTSDEFFTLRPESMYDVIFIDGLHTRDQVHKDVINSLIRIKSNGYVVCHDCSPWGPEVLSPMMGGTCWEAIAQLRLRPDLDIYTVDIDTGVSVITDNSNTNPVDSSILPLEFTYEYVSKHRHKLLNLISYEEYINKEFTPKPC